MHRVTALRSRQNRFRIDAVHSTNGNADAPFSLQFIASTRVWTAFVSWCSKQRATPRNESRPNSHPKSVLPMFQCSDAMHRAKQNSDWRNKTDFNGNDAHETRQCKDKKGNELIKSIECTRMNIAQTLDSEIRFVAGYHCIL